MICISVTIIAVVDAIGATKIKLLATDSTTATASIDKHALSTAMSKQAVTAPRCHHHDEHIAAFEKCTICITIAWQCKRTMCIFSRPKNEIAYEVTK